MKAIKVEATIYIERGEEELALTIKGSYHPGNPGKTYGPPENCYPPEPAETEVESVLDQEGKPFVFASKEEEESVYEKGDDALLEAVSDEDDGPDSDPFEPDEPDYFDRPDYEDK